MATKSDSEFHIGAAPHTGRNLGIIGALVALGAVAAVYIMMGQKTDAASLDKLTAFTTAYGTKCDERVKGPPAAMLSHVYLGSTKMQDLVEAQRVALEAGTPCATVYGALHAADLPLPRLN